MAADTMLEPPVVAGIICCEDDDDADALASLNRISTCLANNSAMRRPPSPLSSFDMDDELLVEPLSTSSSIDRTIPPKDSSLRKATACNEYKWFLNANKSGMIFFSISFVLTLLVVLGRGVVPLPPLGDDVLGGRPCLTISVPRRRPYSPKASRRWFNADVGSWETAVSSRGGNNADDAHVILQHSPYSRLAFSYVFLFLPPPALWIFHVVSPPAADPASSLLSSNMGCK
mmetsp:Transcript_28534/g.60809  ORF Transcript_28534/g.60809 Transcript_28534/m.60809 type:complete len:230 (-) Transcript_28534:1895-2584(-)